MAKKVCELCLSPDLGGLELYMMRAARYLGGNCISVINTNGKLKNYFEEMREKYFGLRRRNVLFSWIVARELAKIIDKEGIDVIHLHWTKDIPVAVMAKLFSKRKPKVVQSRHMRMTRFKDDFYHRFLYKNIDLMLAVTQQVKHQIEKFVPDAIRPRVEVLYIGADRPSLITSPEREARRNAFGLEKSFTVGIIGRIEPPKGQHLVLEAVQRMVTEGIDAKALIVGHAMDEEYLQYLQNDYRAIGVFTGFSREAQAMMQLCDVVVLATENETFGLVLIEAMMCGICVVASDSGGPLEIIDNEVNGMLFRTSDSEDLSRKLKALCEDTTLIKRMALEGEHKASAFFDSAKQFEQMQKILEEL